MSRRAISGHHWVMLGHLSFAGSAFADLMRYQVTDRYRPARAPGPGPNKELAYVDGLHIMNITLATSTHANPFTVNGQGPDGKVGPLPGAGAFLVPDVTLNLSGNVYFADVSEVARAGMKDPKVTARPVLLGTTRLWISIYVDAAGVPHLRGALDPTGIPPDLLPAVNDIAAFDMPFPVTSIFAGAMGLPAGVTQVLNAGVALTGEDIVFRFEFASQDALSESEAARRSRWVAFYSGQQPSRLSGRDWALDLDGAVVAERATAAFDGEMKDQKPVVFTGEAWGSFVSGKEPGVDITKRGYFDSVCAGSDIRFKATPSMRFSIVNGNMRTKLRMDYEKEVWDTVKCLGLALVNPFFFLITGFDQGVPAAGFLDIVGLNLPPLKPLALSIGLAFGLDRSLVLEKVDKSFSDKPDYKKIGDGEYAIDYPIPTSTGLTKSWLSVLEVEGEGNRLVYRGTLAVPAPILPRLRAVSVSGLSEWHLVDGCEPSHGQECHGSLVLTLVPGYGPPGPQPTIPLYFGYADGKNLTFEIVDDVQNIPKIPPDDQHVLVESFLGEGVYRDPVCTYLSFSGIPGTVEVRVHDPLPRFFKHNPYPLRLRFYTNGGIREYAFDTPPEYIEYHETIAQAMERISNCKRKMSSLVLARMLQLHWLVDPPPDSRVGQYWQLYLTGIGADRPVTVWSQDTGAALGHYKADHAGSVEITCLVPPRSWTKAILLTLDDVPFMDDATVRATLARIQDPVESAMRFHAQQTLLIEAGALAYSTPVASLELHDRQGQPTLVARLVNGDVDTHIVTEPHSSLRLWRLDAFRIRPTDAGRYPSWAAPERGAVQDNLFAHVEADARLVTVYRRGATRYVTLDSGVPD